MASWCESGQGGNRTQGEPAAAVASFPLLEHPSLLSTGCGPHNRQGDEKGSEKRRAAPDVSGLPPGWQRRHDDRDPLDDMLADKRQSEDWERVEPSGGSGTEGNW